MYKTDSNQKEIMDLGRQVGWSVFNTAPLGHGFPDLCVGTQGKNFLIEVKPLLQKKYRLTPSELRFHGSWKGQKIIIQSFEELYDFISKDINKNCG